LTSTEFKILSLLASKKGRVFTRDQILDHLWGHEKIVLDRTIDVHIKNLREKLGPASHFIKNIRGVGYKVEE
jgi:two-component system phosphate regulon response regulator PhoB/two-component system alkaline phosphatase synthesis response regulator PhoP